MEEIKQRQKKQSTIGFAFQTYIICLQLLLPYKSRKLCKLDVLIYIHRSLGTLPFLVLQA